jgi:hypothetical protein
MRSELRTPWIYLALGLCLSSLGCRRSRAPTTCPGLQPAIERIAAWGDGDAVIIWRRGQPRPTTLALGTCAVSPVGGELERLIDVDPRSMVSLGEHAGRLAVAGDGLAYVPDVAVDEALRIVRLGDESLILGEDGPIAWRGAEGDWRRVPDAFRARFSEVLDQLSASDLLWFEAAGRPAVFRKLGEFGGRVYELSVGHGSVEPVGERVRTPVVEVLDRHGRALLVESYSDERGAVVRVESYAAGASRVVLGGQDAPALEDAWPWGSAVRQVTQDRVGEPVLLLENGLVLAGHRRSPPRAARARFPWNAPTGFASHRSRMARYAPSSSDRSTKSRSADRRGYFSDGLQERSDEGWARVEIQGTSPGDVRQVAGAGDYLVVVDTGGRLSWRRFE